MTKTKIYEGSSYILYLILYRKLTYNWDCKIDTRERRIQKCVRKLFQQKHESHIDDLVALHSYRCISAISISALAIFRYYYSRDISYKNDIVINY